MQVRKILYIVLENLLLVEVVLESYSTITGQSSPLKKLKNLLQTETAGNLVWLMHHVIEVFGKGLFPL